MEREQTLGMLRVRVIRGVNLAIRDFRSSDPYIILRMGKQKLKTRVMKKNLNPEWNEDLTLAVEDPVLPIRLEVYDWDMLSLDDPMGHAEFDIQPLIDAVRLSHEGLPNGTILHRVRPGLDNCLVENSDIYTHHGSVVQDIILRLRNVECGEVEVQLRWSHVPNSSART